ncbi:DUF6440 family protein [Allofournierella sp.]|uniref:DUF6440 family protein n=1 Tax=Allofournierella sp. TaxID=1940256 RepID=UPI003AB25A4D
MSDRRFEIVYSQGGARGLFVLRDRETGVHYLLAKFGYTGGLTPLLDASGKPIVTPPAQRGQAQ